MQLTDGSLLKTQAFVDGNWINANNGETFAVTKPATGEVVAEVARCGGDETRRAIEARGFSYAYLDGKTKNRSETVERFENDPSCSVFLISLKAGGCGLNLTSSDYVFILDPWWNPAVEAQAIDRAHRMGQERPVFAYRLIARDTVEEKILALKDDKRRLADAVFAGEGGVLDELFPGGVE